MVLKAHYISWLRVVFLCKFSCAGSRSEGYAIRPEKLKELDFRKRQFESYGTITYNSHSHWSELWLLIILASASRYF